MHLLLASSRGNKGGRFFPYTGFLGLTPVKIEGSVRTVLDEDRKTLLSNSITVYIRCLETRVGRVGNTHTSTLVEFKQTLWTKFSDVPYEALGDFEVPFKFILPSNIGGYSTANFQDYRVFWRIDAVLEHIPVPAVGSRQIKSFEIPLVRYDLPPITPTTSPRSSLSPVLDCQTSKPRAPILDYSITSPRQPVAPLDEVPVMVHIRPRDKDISIRGASLLVERRLTLKETTPAPPSTASSASSSSTMASTSRMPGLSSRPWTSPGRPTGAASTASSQTLLPVGSRASLLIASESYTTSVAASSFSLASSDATTITPDDLRPLIAAPSETPANLFPASDAPATSAPPKTVTMTVAGAEPTGRFSRDEQTGVWSKTISLQWPAAKSHSRWAIGETLNTGMASVRFWIKIKVIISSSAGTETVELDERELHVVSTNEAERKAAIAKFAELQDSFRARSQSRSPRTTRRGGGEPTEQEEAPPLPKAQGRPVTAHGASSSSSAAGMPDNATASGSGSGSSGTRRSSSRTAAGKSGSSDAIAHCGPSSSTHRQKRPHTSAGSSLHQHSSDSGPFGLFGKRSRLSAAANGVGPSVVATPEVSKPGGTGSVGPSDVHTGAFSSSSLSSTSSSASSGKGPDTQRMKSLARTESAKSDMSVDGGHHRHIIHGRRHEKQHQHRHQPQSAWWPMASPSSSTGTTATTATTTTRSSASSMHDDMHTDTSASSLADVVDHHDARAISSSHNSNSRSRSSSKNKVHTWEEEVQHQRIGAPTSTATTPSKSRKSMFGLGKINKLLRRGNSPPT